MKKKNNIAFIDGQNLYFGCKEQGWKIDYKKFRNYLEDSLNVREHESHYWLGYVDESYQSLYDSLQKAGFIVKFKQHTALHESKKKGNVDTDIVFHIMEMLYYKKDDFDKIVLVSGDGDYKKIVDLLLKEEKFERIIFPDGKKASSLYNSISSKYKLAINRLEDKVKYGV